MSGPSWATARLVLIEGRDQPPEDRLYAHWYHAESEEQRLYPGGDAYRAAAADPDRMEAGWTVAEPAAGAAAAVIAVRSGERRLVAPPDCAPACPGRLHLRVGDSLLVDPFAGGVANGFWHLWPPAWRRGAPDRIQRLYCAVAEGAELEFLRRLVRLAMPADAWSAKLLTGVHRRGRRDPALLYLAAEAVIDEGWIAMLSAAVGGLLGGPPPRGTRLLAPGIGWAEDPGGGISFGQHLCRLLAGAAGRPDALASARSWRSAVAAAFAEVGLDAARPELCSPAGAEAPDG